MILCLKMRHSDYLVYAQDGAERERAYLHLFDLMGEYDYYNDLEGDLLDWYTKAKSGDAKAAERLLSYRSDQGYEYERIEKIYPETP